jgi:putative DNA primase/helicase
MNQIIAEFADAIRGAGIVPPSMVKEASKFTRFDVNNGKINSDKSGWCVQFADGLGGSFGDWSTG